MSTTASGHSTDDFVEPGQRFAVDESLSFGDRLGEITCPTTVLVGSLDHPLVDVAPRLAEGVPDARLVEIAGAYHSPQLTHSSEWLAAVRGHVARAEQR